MRDEFFQKVYNRGAPPEAFITELVAWGTSAPDEIFSPDYRSSEPDIYASIAARRPELLGDFNTFHGRRALMCEVLRVLGGYESSWRWNEGRDVTNPTENRPETKSAGIFQVSANSNVFSPTLVRCFLRYGGEMKGNHIDYEQFQRIMKENHFFAFEYTARLLRFTIHHHGPVKRYEIHSWMKADAVAAFQELIDPVSLAALRDDVQKAGDALDDLLEQQ